MNVITIQMSQLLRVDSAQKQLQFGEQSAQLDGPMADLLVEALLTMLPAEKLPMMAPTTTRGYTLPAIGLPDYDLLNAAVAHVNQDLGAEVLRLNSRVREPGVSLAAKILLGDKSVVKGVSA